MKENVLVFEDIRTLTEALVSSSAVNGEGFSTLIADFDIVWDVAMELYSDGYEFDLIDVDRFEYDGEYCLTVSECCDDNDDNAVGYISVDKAFNQDDGCYYPIPGAVFVHRAVNKDFITQNLKSRIADSFYPVVFSFIDDEEPEDEEEVGKKTCIDMDDDRCGFTYCTCEDGFKSEFRYRVSKPLSDKEVKEIIASYF